MHQNGEGEVMNASNHSNGFDEPLPMPMTARRSDGYATTSGSTTTMSSSTSIYRALLRQHQQIVLFNEDSSKGKDNDGEGDSCEWRAESDGGDSLQSERNSKCSTTCHSRHLRRENTDSLVDNLSSRSGSSRSRSHSSSLYPRIINDSFDDGHLGMEHLIDAADLAHSVSGSSEPSSFYQEALKEATRMQDKEGYSERAPDDYNEEERDTKTATTTTSIDENSYIVSTSISPFYRAALENAALVEEEELSLLKQYEQNRAAGQEIVTSVEGYTAREAARGALSKQSSFYRSALEGAIAVEQDMGAGHEGKDFEDDTGTSTDLCSLNVSIQRQSTICSFSSSSTSSRTKRLASPLVVTTPVLSRGTTNEYDLSQVQRNLSDVSLSSSSVHQVRTEAISPDRSSLPFVDDSSAYSITRSMAMPHMTGSVLLTAANEADTKVPQSGKGVSIEMNEVRGVFENFPGDTEDDEDLQMAIYLSRVESSAASSFNSEGTRSASLSTKGSRSLPEGDSKKENHRDRSRASYSTIENDDEFLMSQIRAMEECQRNKCNRNPPMTGYSTASPTSRDCHFESSRDTTTSSSTSSTSHSSATSTNTTSSHLSSRGERRRRRSLLETRGASETRQAICNGDSHVVRCKGCNGRLQAPLHYALVFCPKCQTVSPA